MNFLLKTLKKNEFVNQRMGYLLEASNYAKAKFTKKHHPLVKFVIFGTGRSGSTLLVDLMHSNPHIHCDNELFHRKLYSPLSFLECRSQMFNTTAYGFKCLTYQIQEILGFEDQKKFINDLYNLGYKIIYLHREDTFKQALSNIYARQRNLFHAKTIIEIAANPKITVDLDILDDWMTRLDEQKAREKKWLEDIPHFKVLYEKDLLDPASQYGTIEKICAFLGVPHSSPEAQLKKVSPKRLEEYIENLNEVKTHLSGKGTEEIL